MSRVAADKDMGAFEAALDSFGECGDVIEEGKEAPPGGGPGHDGDKSAGATTPAAYHRHVVCPSDTLAGLLIRYGISLRELKRHNDFPRVRWCDFLWRGLVRLSPLFASLVLPCAACRQV